MRNFRGILNPPPLKNIEPSVLGDAKLRTEKTTAQKLFSEIKHHPRVGNHQMVLLLRLDKICHTPHPSEKIISKPTLRFMTSHPS